MLLAARRAASAMPVMCWSLLVWLLFAVAGPVPAAAAVGEQLVQATGGWFGIRVQDLTQESASARGFAGQSGVLVSAVIPGSPAANAGLRAGDIVVEIDARRLARMRPLVALIGSRQPGQEVSVVFHRDGRRQETTVRLGDKTTAARVVPGDDAQEAEYRRGYAAYQAGDHARAAQIMRPLADYGGEGSRYFVGYLNEMGQGLPRDVAEAAYWYRLSAESGLGQAQIGLARLYEAGQGVPRDLPRAFHWYDKAAARGAEGAAAERDRLAGALSAGQRQEAAALAALMPDTIETAPQQAAETAAPMPKTATQSAAKPKAEKKEPARPKPDPGMVREIQRRLAGLGFDPGPADGLMGRRTREAIRAFQRREGLAADGRPGAQVLSRLRESAASAEAQTSPEPAPTPTVVPEAQEPAPVELEGLEDLDDF